MLDEDPVQVVWWATPVECSSAIARVQRLGQATRSEAQQGREVLLRLAQAWNEIVPTKAVRERAEELLRRHPLSAGDALQLAAALSWALDRPRGHRFFCLDDRLNDAAEREGFTLVRG